MLMRTSAGMEAGPVEPAEGAVDMTSGTPRRAQAIVLSAATSSRLSGGETMARQAKLPASPQSAAISRMTASESPPKGLETTIGLLVAASMAANCARSTTSPSTSSGRAIDMTKSICGSFSHSAAAAVTSARRARRRSPVSRSQT